MVWCGVTLRPRKRRTEGGGLWMDGDKGWNECGRALLLRGLYVKSKQLGSNHFIVL